MNYAGIWVTVGASGTSSGAAWPLLCAWVSLHPNVPTQGKGWLWKLWRRAVAFGIALVAPEYIIGLAYNQRAVAKEIAAEHKHHKWTLTHGFFANMGGFVVRGTNGKDHVLHPDDIDAYLRNGQINMTEDEIQDKSKGDMLTKGFVVLQTTWFILQLIARAIQHLPVTELEIATLGFAILNGATYALWWSKPLDVQCPIVLIDHVLAADTETGADGSMGSDGMGGDHAYGGMRDHLIKQKHSQISRVSFLAVGVRDETSSAGAYVLAAIGAIFGGIHCIAWAFHFPTSPERLLWQISSIITAILPITLAVYKLVDAQVSFPEAIDDIFGLVVMFLYAIARLLLLVIAFTTLRSLPPDTYTTVQWTTFLPHI